MKHKISLVATLLALLLVSGMAFATGTVVTVVDKQFLNQTSTPTTTIYTPTVNGIFRVCVYATVTSGSTFTSPTVILQWQDESTRSVPDTVIFGSANGESGSIAIGCVPIVNIANNGITIQASASGDVYDLFVTVEKLP